MNVEQAAQDAYNSSKALEQQFGQKAATVEGECQSAVSPKRSMAAYVWG